MYALTDRIETLLDQSIRGQAINAMLFCPFHDNTNTPAFSIHQEEGLWYCFGCNRKGSLVQLYRSLGEEVDEDYRQDVLIRDTLRVPEIPKDLSPIANAYLGDIATREGRKAVARYCRSRPVSPEFIGHFSVGYSAEKDALCFPYIDSEGRVTGIKYRFADGSKASVSGSGYGLYNGDNGVGQPVVVIGEGESDTHALWSLLKDDSRVGVVGTSGASVSQQTWERYAIDLLFSRRIYLCYDADEQGDKCAATAMRVLGDDKCIRVRPPDGQDISKFVSSGGQLADIGLEIDGLDD